MPDEKYVNHPTGNGGFPLPAPGHAERLLESSHAACSGRTRVRLPAALPMRAVRRVVCDHCDAAYDPAELVEVRPERRRLRSPRPAMPSLKGRSLPMPSLSLPSSLPTVTLPSGLDARWLTLPIAALAVFAILSLVRGDEPTPGGAPPAEAETAAKKSPKSADRSKARDGAAAASTSKAAVPTDAQLVAESTFSLALPVGWERVTPAAGATFAAVSSDSTADATLWIQNDPKLDMATFEANSIEQLQVLAGSAQVVDRKLGPTPEQTSITLAPKGAPDGAPAYEVVLRSAGDNWYYLATTVQPGAPSDAVAGVELIQGSFVAQGGKP